MRRLRHAVHALRVIDVRGAVCFLRNSRLRAFARLGAGLGDVEDFGDVLVTRDGGEVLDVSADKAAASVKGFMTSHEFKGV